MRGVLAKRVHQRRRPHLGKRQLQRRDPFAFRYPGLLTVQRRDFLFGCRKTQNLSCMQVHGQNPVGPRLGNHVRDQFCRYRRARCRLASLTRIPGTRDHIRNAPDRRSTERIDEHEQYHQVVVCRIGRGSDNRDIIPPHVFPYLAKTASSVTRGILHSARRARICAPIASASGRSLFPQISFICRAPPGRVILECAPWSGSRPGTPSQVCRF